MTLTSFLGDYRLPLSAEIEHLVRQFWRAARRRRTWRFRQPRPVELRPGDIVIADEAGMIGTPAMRKLVELVERAGATLLLVGDPSQLPSVEGTPPLRYLTQKYGAPILKEIRRQKEQWARKAASLFAEGNVGRALVLFARHRQVIVRDDFDEVVRQACSDWAEEGLFAPHRVLMLANTNDLSHKANLLAQEHRLRAGCIRATPSLRITDEQHEGVFESRVYCGDRVIFHRNSRELGVTNGSTGYAVSVNWITNEIVVVLDNKQYVKVNVRAYPHLRLAYAITTWKSQSASIPKVLAIVGDETQNFPASYVQATRAVESTTFYTIKRLIDPHLRNARRSLLAVKMSRKPDLRLATELLDDTYRPPRRQEISLRKFADFANQRPTKNPRMMIVGMPRHFWVVTTPTPMSTMDDICFRSGHRAVRLSCQGGRRCAGQESRRHLRRQEGRRCNGIKALGDRMPACPGQRIDRSGFSTGGGRGDAGEFLGGDHASPPLNDVRYLR